MAKGKNYPAFMNATGLVKKILEKIKVAATPERFTQDYLSTELGFSGGSARAFIPLAKKMNLIASDGSPTEIYKQFRNTNPQTSKAAMAKALQNAYPEVYARNEYAHSLSRPELEGLIVELTGLEKGHSTVTAILGTFESIKSFADFKAKAEVAPTEDEVRKDRVDVVRRQTGLSLGLAYTINLVLPKTDDIAVFNAIFASLKTHLLSD